jgi:hypothetical protein
VSSHIAKIALIGNYIAASFVTAADGHGGTLVTEAAQTANQLLPSPSFSIAMMSALISLSVCSGYGL